MSDLDPAHVEAVARLAEAEAALGRVRELACEWDERAQSEKFIRPDLSRWLATNARQARDALDGTR